MNRLQFLLAFLTTCTLLCSVRPAHAQGRWPYSPSRPTFSPYFGLFRLDPGPLGRYHSYVRRDKEVDARLAGLERASQPPARAVQRPSGVLRLPFAPGELPEERGLTLRPTLAGGTGAGAGFMNYSHYYQRQGAARRPGSYSPSRSRSSGSSGAGRFGGF